MGFEVVDPETLEWINRPHEAAGPARHVRELSEAAGFTHGDTDLLVYAHGHLPEETTAEILGDAV